MESKINQGEIRFVVTIAEGWAKWKLRKVIRRYKLTVIRQAIPRAVMYNVITVANTDR